MPEIAGPASGRHQPPLVSARSAHTTEPPDCGVPAVVGVVLALFAPPPALLPPLEHAAANSVSATTDAANEPRRRGRLISGTVVPPGSGTTIARGCLRAPP